MMHIFPLLLLSFVLPLLGNEAVKSEYGPVEIIAKSSAEDCNWPLWERVQSVQEYAQKIGLPATETFDLGSGVTMEMVLIPPGEFNMGTAEPVQPEEDVMVGASILCLGTLGLIILVFLILRVSIRNKARPQFSLGKFVFIILACSLIVLGTVRWNKAKENWIQYEIEYDRYVNAEDNEKPSHLVSITHSLYIGKYEVTQEQFQQVMGFNRCRFKNPTNPADSITSERAEEFCKKLSERLRRTFRLPSEAEWEYSARAGTSSMIYSGNSEIDLGRVAWYSGNSKGTTHPVGSKGPNAFGLFDSIGNVQEWCQDDYYSYSRSPQVNPRYWENSGEGVLRGGSYFWGPPLCRAAYRRKWDREDLSIVCGLRIVLEIDFSVQQTQPGLVKE